MEQGVVPAEGALEELDVDGTTWRVDREFLRSNWTCIWGRGCQGILSEPSEHLQQGCCSVGAGIDGDDEAMNLAALAATIPAHRFQYHDIAVREGIFSTPERRNTRVVDGACIFLNRPGFSGGAGCALHLAAVDSGESPLDWKPSVCWQLPIRVEWQDRGDGGEIATLRRWKRADWDDDEEDLAWWCTEAPEAYSGDRPVIDSLAEELDALLGPAVRLELRRRLA